MCWVSGRLIRDLWVRHDSRFEEGVTVLDAGLFNNSVLVCVCAISFRLKYFIIGSLVASVDCFAFRASLRHLIDTIQWRFDHGLLAHFLLGCGDSALDWRLDSAALASILELSQVLGSNRGRN